MNDGRKAPDNTSRDDSGGAFIVLEGIDGAGTTTQMSELARVLSARGLEVHTTREPSDGPIGTLLRLFLRGRVASPGGRPGWEMMALLFAADRMDHVAAEIEPVLQRGGVVLSDRYDASSIAYQSVSSESAAGEDAVAWIRTLNRAARRPDLVIVVDVSSDEALARRTARGGAPELYERHELQTKLAAFYRDLSKHMPNDRIVVVSGEGTKAEVTERLVRAVGEALPRLVSR